MKIHILIAYVGSALCFLVGIYIGQKGCVTCADRGVAYKYCEPVKILRSTKERTLYRDNCNNYFVSFKQEKEQQ